MISKETFKNAISKIDDKYIVQAVEAGADAGAEAQGHAETARTGRKSSGVRRGVAGTRSAIIAASLIVVGIIAGIAITIGVRHRKNVSPISGEAETESPTDGLVLGPTAVPIPENYIDASELIDLIYSDSVDPAVSDPAALPMTPPGARDDVRTLRRASDALAGKTLTVRVNYMESNELFAAEPVFALFRDVAGGEELDSGTVVLMLSKNVYGDESVPQLVTEVRSVLISGRTDNISNLFLSDNSSFSDFFGPITVEQVSIISFLDHMYPREAVYAAVNEFSLKYGNFLYSYPLYTLVSSGDNAVKQPLIRPDSIGVLGSVGSGVAMPVPFFMDAGSVDLKPLLETFERFGISYPDTETVEGARFADNIHSSVELIEAFL
ncbi:MAG: hypothetical protein J5950_07565, partial [Clostridia bacterium]|nr:hypothetical protein [Clostridia bacterium]